MIITCKALGKKNTATCTTPKHWPPLIDRSLVEDVHTLLYYYMPLSTASLKKNDPLDNIRSEVRNRIRKHQYTHARQVVYLAS